MIPAVRALIGPERELKAGWFEKVRWLRQLHAPRRLRPQVLTDDILRDDDVIMAWAQRALHQAEGHQALTRRVLALQARLQRTTDERAWAAYLDLEQALNERAAFEIIAVVRRACESEAGLRVRKVGP